MRDGQISLPLAAALILTMGLAACGGPKHRTTPIPERPAPQSVLNCPPGQTCDSGTIAPAGAKGSSTEEAIEEASAKSNGASSATVASNAGRSGRAGYSRGSYRRASYSRSGHVRGGRRHGHCGCTRPHRIKHYAHHRHAERHWEHRWARQDGGHYGYLDSSVQHHVYDSGWVSPPPPPPHPMRAHSACRSGALGAPGYLCWPGKVPADPRGEDGPPGA